MMELPSGQQMNNNIEKCLFLHVSRKKMLWDDGFQHFSGTIITNKIHPSHGIHQVPSIGSRDNLLFLYFWVVTRLSCRISDFPTSSKFHQIISNHSNHHIYFCIKSYKNPAYFDRSYNFSTVPRLVSPGQTPHVGSTGTSPCRSRLAARLRLVPAQPLGGAGGAGGLAIFGPWR